MQILIVLSAMLFVVVTPYLASWDRSDVEWSEDTGDAGPDLADAGDAEHHSDSL